MAQTVTIGEQKVCPESESLKFSTTPTPQVENPSDSDSTALVRSLDKNKHELDDFFQMTKVNPTFIAISGTTLKPNFIVNINIPGFNFVHNPSQTNSGGVGLYTNSKLTYQLRNDLNLQNVGCESLFIETPTSSGKPCIIGVIYRHPAHAFPPFQDEFIKLVTHP